METVVSKPYKSATLLNENLASHYIQKPDYTPDGENIAIFNIKLAQV